MLLVCTCKFISCGNKSPGINLDMKTKVVTSERLSCVKLNSCGFRSIIFTVLVYSILMYQLLHISDSMQQVVVSLLGVKLWFYVNSTITLVVEALLTNWATAFLTLGVVHVLITRNTR